MYKRQEYTQLKELLTPEEYAAARNSTLNAHYTSPTVIQAIYEAVSRMGFETGNILEPSMGVEMCIRDRCTVGLQRISQ